MNIFTEEKYIKHLNRKVKTPFGYQTIEYIYRTIPLPALKFTLENLQTIEVAAQHTFIIEDEEYTACDLQVGDCLQTISGLVKIAKIEDSGTIELYDISLDQSEFDNCWYYADGILSHNSGKSITVACYLCWLFVFFKEKNIGIVANRASQAREFLRNTKDIFVKLPMWLVPGVNEWNKGTIANENEMRILTDVPSSDSFRGFSVHCISCNSNLTIQKTNSNITVDSTIGNLYQNLQNNC